MMNSTATAKPASDKQRAFAQKLNGERLVPDAGRSPAEATLWERNFDLVFDPSKFVSTREASAVINWLLGLPRKPAEPQGDQPEVGIYVLQDGTIVKVKERKDKRGVYTNRWVEIRGTRLVDATEDHVHGEWDYDPGLKRQLPTARRMTLDEAKDFILRYGQCVRCGRRLKAADSVERGIGPVCINYFQQFAV